MIKAVIFDLDGTVCDTLSTIAHYCNVTLEYCGFPTIEEKKFKYMVGDGKKLLVHRMLEYFNADTEENFEKAEKKYDFEYESDVIYNTTPFEKIPEVLRKLKQDGKKIAVLSNKPDNVTVMVVEKLFGDLFDVCHGKRDGIETKPNPQGVQLLTEELGVNAEECIFVGDTNVDIKTAKNSNMKSIGVLWGFRDYDELNEAGADYIIDDPMKIFEIVSEN